LRGDIVVEAEWTRDHGQALRERRRRRGQTQEMLAEIAGVSIATIKNIERGTQRPRASTLQLIAKALDCQPDMLQGGSRLPSVAVLPFRDLSPAADQDYFCEGLAEELINALVHVKGLRVAARTSSFYFKERREDLRAIGDALGVETVLEGSVRTADDIAVLVSW
jgi:transcriptional regulator with XRE-family HTH domain